MAQTNHKNHKNQKKKQSSKRNNRNGRRGNQSMQMIPRQVGLILPDMYRTKLRFWKQVPFNFTATNVVGVRFRPSSAFDVDPLFATTAMAGFTEMATIYASYRVIQSKCNVEVITASPANPTNIQLVPANMDPGATPPSAYVIAQREQPYAKFGLTGLSGSAPLKLTSVMKTQRMFGSRMIMYDDNFSSLTNTSPVNNWFWVITGSVSVFDPNLTWVTITIDVDVQFFDRFTLNN